jgi:hypothetical protein
MALLACLINHPQIFDYVEERIGILDMGEGRLNLARQSIVEYLLENHGVSRESLVLALEEDGFGDCLRGLLNDTVYTHAGFARPSTPEDDINTGWDRAWAMLSQIEASQEQLSG